MRQRSAGRSSGAANEISSGSKKTSGNVRSCSKWCGAAPLVGTITRFPASISDTTSGGKPIGPSTFFSFSARKEGKYSVRRRSASTRSATKLDICSRAGVTNRICAWKYVRRPSIVSSNTEMARFCFDSSRKRRTIRLASFVPEWKP